MVRIKRPRPEARSLPDRVELRLVEVIEPAPPQGVEPLHWRLLTTHAVADAASAWRIVDWYSARWTIEQLWRLLKKQGLRLESSQLESAESLLKLSAIAVRAATVTLQLMQARDGASKEPASLAFDKAETAVLTAFLTARSPTPANPHATDSLAWAAWIIARLGGWDGYASSRRPGPITLKHGLDRFRVLVEGWLLREQIENMCIP